MWPVESSAVLERISLRIVGQALRLLWEHAITRQAGRLPYNRKRGLLDKATS